MAVPLVLAAWCAGIGAGSTWLTPSAVPLALVTGMALASIAAAALGAGRCNRPALVALVGLAVGAAGVARGAAAVHVPGPATADYHIGRHVTVTGTVTRSSGGPGFQSAWVSDLHLASGPGLAGTLQVTARSSPLLVPGQLVRVVGVEDRLPARARDGTTGYDDRMERLGVEGVIPSASITVLRPAPSLAPATVVWRIREAVSTRLRARLPDPEATILLGVLLGIRGRLPGGIETDLVDSGLIHLLAVSGLKVALVGGLLAAVLRQTGRRAALLAIAAIFGYALVGGGSAAALRAALMTSLGLTARVLRRDSDPPRNLLLAAGLMLGGEPQLAGDPSFLYSFVGVSGILLIPGALRGLSPAVPAILRGPLGIGVAAQLATAPLTAAYFHVVPVVAPLANLVALPLLAPTLAATAWLGAGLPDPAGVVGAGALGSAHLVLVLASTATHIPGGAVATPWFGLPQTLGCYSAGAVVVAGAARRWPMTGVIPAACAAALAVTIVVSRPDGRMHLAALDTPGGGVQVTAPDGARMLVDTGASAAALAASMASRSGPGSPPLDALVLTGAGRPATAGIGGLGGAAPRSLLVATGVDGGSADWIASAFDARGLPVTRLVAGDRFGWHGIAVTVTGCGPGIGLLLSVGRGSAWICDAGTASEPPDAPPGPLAMADVGDGAATPWGGLPGSGWVVVHGARAGRGDLSAAALGPRLWRTSRDGPLDLACGADGCVR